MIVDDCGNLPQKELRRGLEHRLLSQFHFGEKEGSRSIPPPPWVSESRDWRGVCKNGLQNLERVRARGQNLENKRVKFLFAISAYTASALAMICFLNFAVKVRYHIWAEEKLDRKAWGAGTRVRHR